MERVRSKPIYPVLAAATIIAGALLASLALARPADAQTLGAQQRISKTGPDGDTAYNADTAKVAPNPEANQYLVVWRGETATDGELEIYGRLLGPGGAALGDQFRISDMGPDGSAAFRASKPTAAYNPAANEYLVAWHGVDDTAPLVEGQEIFAQRLSAAGVEVGPNDLRVSDMGPDGNADFDAFAPALAYNAAANEYLIAWDGDDNTAPLVDNEFEIFAQRLSAAGAEVGPNDLRVSAMGYDGHLPAVAYSRAADEFLVAWEGVDDTAGEEEIFAQRLSAAGVEVGPDDLRVSDMGPDGNADYDARRPTVAYNPAAAEYLIAWDGEDNTAPLVEGEFEIFAQRVSAAGAEVGPNDLRVSDMGPPGNAGFEASTPAVAYDPAANEYLVAWDGDDDTGRLVVDEDEIFAQRLAASGAEVGLNDLRVSDMGPDGNTAFSALTAAVAYNPPANEYLVAWNGDDDTAPAVDDDVEIFARTAGPPLPPGPAPTPAPDPAPAPPSADGTVTVELGSGKLELSERGVVRLPIACPAEEASAPCSGKVVLRTQRKVSASATRRAKPRRVRLASARFSLSAGESDKLRLKLKPARRELVEEVRKARKAIASASVQDAAGNEGKAGSKLRLRPLGEREIGAR